MDRSWDAYGSPDTQHEDCLAWIGERLEFVLGEIHFEENVSGGSPLHKRPGLSACLARMRAGASHGVVVRQIDRFMRSVRL